MKAIPADLQKLLGKYEPVQFDSFCSEPFGWGHKIVAHLGPENKERLKAFGKVHCIPQMHGYEWVLILRTLTHTEAIQQYGQVSAEEKGPRGGFISRTYGTKKFINKLRDK